jgi:hypothetical protein
MFSLFRKHTVGRAICEGRVACPQRDAEVDVEECAGCTYLDAIDGSDIRTGAVRCSPPLARVADPVHMHWACG